MATTSGELIQRYRAAIDDLSLLPRDVLELRDLAEADVLEINKLHTEAGRLLGAAENRLYNSKQREILAAKFGGCMDPDCERPPSWSEAHHIAFVKRDGGKTTIANAILLCKYHHLK